MLYLLIILFPLSMAASCFVMRKHTELVIIASVAVILTQMALVVQIPLDAPSRLLGVTLALNKLTQLFMLVFLGMGALSFLISWHLPHGENFVPVTLVILAVACTILLLQDPFIVSLLLVWAGVVAVLAIVDQPAGAGVLVDTRTIASALKYLILMVIAGVLIYLSFVLADIYRPGDLPGRIPLVHFILALMTAGFALRLALIPFHTWLPDVVEDASPMVSALIVAVINTTSLLVLILSLQRFPILVTENPSGMTLLRVGGIITSVLSGLMALNQTTIRRALGYLLMYNSGMIFYGVASVSVSGLTGATFEALNQTLAVVLIFASLGLLERPDNRPPGVERRDLLRRWPVAGTAFLGGGMALLGIPPFSGFASKMLLYQAAATHGWFELLALLLATMLAVLALIHIVYTNLLGPSEHSPSSIPDIFYETEFERPSEHVLSPEPHSTAIVVVLLLIVSLVVGLYPQPFLLTMNDVVSGLTFVNL